MSHAWPLWLLFGSFAAVVLILALDRAFLAEQVGFFVITKAVHAPAMFDAVSTAYQYGSPYHEDRYVPDSYRWWLARDGKELFLEVWREDFGRYPVGATVAVCYSVRRISKTTVYRGIETSFMRS